MADVPFSAKSYRDDDGVWRIWIYSVGSDPGVLLRIMGRLVRDYGAERIEIMNAGALAKEEL